MNNKKRTCLLCTYLVLLLALTHQLLFFSTASVQVSASIPSGSGGRIDLFTQKEPYSGRGIGNASDAFSPKEEVILYAYVTYNDDPRENLMVVFEILDPHGNSRYFAQAFTNASGIANPTHSLQLSENEESFGVWRAVANVDILAGMAVSDKLTFKVGYIVEIVSIATIDENLQPKTRFPKATCVGAKLQIRNIAMLPKTTTIIVSAFDGNNTLFDSIIWRDFIVEPGDTYIFAHCFLNISEQAKIGDAMINASALTALPTMGGVTYCPEVSAKFVITFRNVAVTNVTISSGDVIAGEMVNVTVTVANEGDETETFSVTAYYGSFPIQTHSVASLSPNENRTITFAWNTTFVSEGFYIISATASKVPGETDTSDNVFPDGPVVRVRVPRIFMFSRELSIVVLIVAAAFALLAMAILLTRKKSGPQPVMLNVDVVSS